MGSEFKRIDHHALGAPASVTRSIDALASYLVEPAGTDLEKARSLFRWIAANIEYDVHGYFNPAVRTHQGADEAFRTRKGVCVAYSGLFKALADRAGLEAVSISGFGKGYSYVPGTRTDGANHDWNAVRIEGEWKLIDCTWGAGHIDKHRRFERALEGFYFLTPPRMFIFTHYPEDPQWQLLPHPIDRSAYDELLFVKPRFFQYGVKPLSHRSVKIDCEGPVKIPLETTQDVVLSAKWEGVADERGLPHCLVQRTGSTFIVHACPRTDQGGILEVYGKARGDAGGYHEIMSYRVVPKTRGEFAAKTYPRTFGEYDEHAAELISPIDGRPSALKAVRFVLKAQGARDVAVVSNDEWHHMKGEDGVFRGDLLLKRGTATVYARYDEGKSYQGLLEYTIS